MRKYWLKILLGALAVFAVGMIGVTLVRRGIAGVHTVVKGSGPITIPLSLVPFVLEGERLGNLDHVTLHRESPSRVTAVELEVKLADSMVAQGLGGCRLAANLEGHSRGPDVNIRVGKSNTVFWCVATDSAATDLEEYGRALLQPGGIEIPLLLPRDLVQELQHLEFADSGAGGPGAEQAESIAAAVERQTDSIDAAVDSALNLSREERRRVLDSITGKARRLGDSLRAVGRSRADSALSAARRMADSLPDR